MTIPVKTLKLLPLFVCLAGCLDAKRGGNIRYRHLSQVFGRLNAAHAVTITIIFWSYSGDCETTVALPTYSIRRSDVTGAGSPAVPSSLLLSSFLFMRLTRSSTMYLSASKRVKATCITAKKMLIRRGVSTVLSETIRLLLRHDLTRWQLYLRRWVTILTSILPALLVVHFESGMFLLFAIPVPFPNIDDDVDQSLS